MAGARRVLDEICESLMGGCQGGPIGNEKATSFFGFEYSPGSMRDRINESFAGPHDWFRNATGSYNATTGNGIPFKGMELAFDTVKNYALVLPAAPLAVSALVTTNHGALTILNTHRR